MGGTCTSEGNYKMSEVITKQKILIADDSEMNRELLAAILEEEYDIIQANDGVQAVDCFQRHAEEISLLLLDIVMPHMDGFEVLSYMNKEHWIDSIPVVIISSENSPIYINVGMIWALLILSKSPLMQIWYYAVRPMPYFWELSSAE